MKSRKTGDEKFVLGRKNIENPCLTKHIPRDIINQFTWLRGCGVGGCGVGGKSEVGAGFAATGSSKIPPSIDSASESIVIAGITSKIIFQNCIDIKNIDVKNIDIKNIDMNSSRPLTNL